jgi:putative lipoic acid-binding regulatory protein
MGSERNPMTDQTKPQLEFPVLFPLRIIGENLDEFQPFVIEIARRHAPDLLEENIVHSLSGGNKYRSISVEFIAQSREQVDALCAELARHECVLMIL